MPGSRTFRYLPLLVFLLVYVLSCVVGALLLMADYRPFVALFEYFSGTRSPDLTSGETRTNLVLLFAAPAALAAGYVLALRLLPLRRAKAEAAVADVPATSRREWVPHAVFYLLAAAAFASLARAGALGRVHSWLDYGSWIHARAANFASISFLEFVNLYVLVPTAAAWAVVATTGKSTVVRLARWVPPLIAVIIALLLFQRKAAISVVLLVAFAWLIDIVRQRARGVRPLIVGTTVAVLCLYFALVVVPVYSRASRAVTQAKEVKSSKTAVNDKQLLKLSKEIGNHSRAWSIGVYSLVSPLTRSSAPALYYPVVFPHEHPYFHLDVGQDIAGIGAMPDDNIVVWNYLNPNLPGGTEMVPYQFVLYSQVGTAGAVALSLLVGFLLALGWLFSQGGRVGRPWNAVLGALVVLWAVYIGIDSLRNSTVVSYGVGWGILFVGAIAGLARLVTLVRRRPAPLAVPATSSLESPRTSRAAAR